MSDARTATAGPARLQVRDAPGATAALAKRLVASDAGPSERAAIAYDHGAETATVRAHDTAALEWLFDWLATCEGDAAVEAAASELARAVEAELETRLIADGGVDQSGTGIDYENRPPRHMDWKPEDDIHVTTGLGYEIIVDRDKVLVEDRFVLPGA